MPTPESSQGDHEPIEPYDDITKHALFGPSATKIYPTAVRVIRPAIQPNKGKNWMVPPCHPPRKTMNFHLNPVPYLQYWLSIDILKERKMHVSNEVLTLPQDEGMYPCLTIHYVSKKVQMPQQWVKEAEVQADMLSAISV